MNADEMAVPEIGATVQDSLPKPSEAPDQAETHAVKKTTPKDSSPHNSEESLDADALDDMFKNAAELLL
jgi:Tfp pilus assembly protein FimV